MKIFVAGATGAIGRPLVTQLLARGHEVVGMTRSNERADKLRAEGAEAVVCDAFDAPRLRDVIIAARPEIVVHQLTDLPQEMTNPRKYKEGVATTTRIREEVTPVLVSAARAAGAKKLVAQSVSFVCSPGSSADVTSEEEPVWLDAPEPLRTTMGGAYALEKAVAGADGMEGIVLRYGYFYGPGTWFSSEGSLVAMIKKRMFPLVGKGTGVWSFVHVDDAAAATVLAIENGKRGVYNVVDDAPTPVNEWLPVVAKMLGASSPMSVPAFLVRLFAGAPPIYMMVQQRGASNAKAKRELGWTPKYSSWRDGLHYLVGSST